MKKKKDKNKMLEYELLGLISLLCVVLFAIQLYDVGMHNLDLGQNMRYLGCEYGINFGDLASDFEVYSGSELYVKGRNQTEKGFNFVLYFTLLFGLGAGYLIGREMHDKKK